MSKGLAEARKKDDRGWRLPASEIEAIVEHQLNRLLHDRPQLTDWLQKFAPNADLAGAFAKAEAWWQAFETNDTLERRHLLAGIVRRVDLKPGEMQIEVDRHAIVVAATGDSVRHATDDADLTVKIRCPMSLRRRGVEMRMVVETDHAPARAPDPHLIELVVRAHRYLERLTTNADVKLTDVAASEAVDPSEISRVLPLAFLSPRLVDHILAGTQPVGLTGQRLSRLSDLPMLWADQHHLLTTI